MISIIQRNIVLEYPALSSNENPAQPAQSGQLDALGVATRSPLPWAATVVLAYNAAEPIAQAISLPFTKPWASIPFGSRM